MDRLPLENIPGDEANAIIFQLRELGYERRISLSGHCDSDLVMPIDFWTIHLHGPPCAGDNPGCYKVAIRGDFLCPVCRDLLR